MRYVLVIVLAAAGTAGSSATMRAAAASILVARAAISASEGTDPVGRASGATAREALEAVVRNRLERRREVEELPVARADPRIAVEHAEPDGADLPVRRLTPQARAA